LKISCQLDFFPFDDAKVRRFLKRRITLHRFLAKEVLIIDANQDSCVRAQVFCARTHIFIQNTDYIN